MAYHCPIITIDTIFIYKYIKLYIYIYYIHPSPISSHPPNACANSPQAWAHTWALKLWSRSGQLIDEATKQSHKIINYEYHFSILKLVITALYISNISIFFILAQPTLSSQSIRSSDHPFLHYSCRNVGAAAKRPVAAREPVLGFTCEETPS